MTALFNSPAEVLIASDIKELDALLLDNDGHLRPLPASCFQDLDRTKLRLWCHKFARYGLPTSELIAWLKNEIGGRQAIEVGAGMGDLGHLLGIRMTDSYIQTREPVKSIMRAMGQPSTHPPASVRQLDAVKAVEKFKPQVVIASWLTQAFAPGDEENQIGSSIYGPDEIEIIRRVETYIHIGNERIHGRKRVLALPHEIYRFPWLVSRAAAPELNCIYVWRK